MKFLPFHNFTNLFLWCLAYMYLCWGLWLLYQPPTFTSRNTGYIFKHSELKQDISGWIMNVCSRKPTAKAELPLAKMFWRKCDWFFKKNAMTDLYKFCKYCILWLCKIQNLSFPLVKKSEQAENICVVFQRKLWLSA